MTIRDYYAVWEHYLKTHGNHVPSFVIEVDTNGFDNWRWVGQVHYAGVDQYKVITTDMDVLTVNGYVKVRSDNWPS